MKLKTNCTSYPLCAGIGIQVETDCNSFPPDRTFSPFSTMHCSLDHQYIVKVYSFEFDSNIEKNYMFIYMEVSAVDLAIAHFGVILTLYPASSALRRRRS